MLLLQKRSQTRETTSAVITPSTGGNREKDSRCSEFKCELLDKRGTETVKRTPAAVSHVDHLYSVSLYKSNQSFYLSLECGRAHKTMTEGWAELQ